jgi:hypothetical protein
MKKIQNNEIRLRKFRGGPVGTRHRTSDSKVALGYFSLGGSCIDCDFSCPSNTGLQKERTLLGQWAPTFLLLGIYNKLVKQLGSDRRENQL